MNKLARLENQHDPEHEEYVFHCPGCRHGHSFIVKWGPKSLANREIRRRENSAIEPGAPCWTFNGDMESPTFEPSLLYKFKRSTGDQEICHLYLRGGMIQFLGDCTHELAGQTLPLEAAV